MVFPFIEGRVLKVSCFARSAAHGVVNHRIESAEVANQLFDCVSALHSIGDIAAQDHRSPAGSGNGSGSFLSCFRTAHTNSNDCASRSKGRSNTTAYASSSPSHKDNSTFHQSGQTAHGCITVPRSATNSAPVIAPAAGDASMSMSPITSSTAEAGGKAG